MSKNSKHSASFRDPNGFLFTYEGKLYRQVNWGYQKHYDALMSSGLYELLSKKGGLVSHQEVELPAVGQEGVYKVLEPELIPFISYPYGMSSSVFKSVHREFLSPISELSRKESTQIRRYRT